MVFKTFIVGLVAGIAGVFAAAYYVPLVDQQRETSIISVTPNGGNTEVFHINVPMDRILIGAAEQANPVPPGLEWPQDPRLADVRAELFKVRNARDAVIGVASRVAARNEQLGDSIEWVMHLPARGSVYVAMQPEPVEGGYRIGELRAGTREFGLLYGQITERWVAAGDPDAEGQAGRIELVTTFVASDEVLDDELPPVEVAQR